MSSHVTRGIWIILALFLATGWVHASVGTVQFSSGDVKIRDVSGKIRDARKGDLINEGDTILTGGQASAQLKMSDGGILAVRQETELKITQYTYTGKEDGTESAFMSLLKGGFRTITGIIGRANKDNYKVSTPTATIGIRGTDHEPHFVPTVPPGAPQPPTPPGTYDKVNVGVAFIATPQGTLNIAQNQVGFAAPNQAPQLLPVMPDIFKVTPPINQAQQEKEAEKEKQAAAEKEKQAAAPKPAAKPAAGTGGQSQESQGTPAAENAADTPAASQAAAPSEVRSSAIVDNTSSPGTGTSTTLSTTTATTTTSTPTITQTVSGTSSSSSLDVNLTTQTVAPSGGGAPAPITQGAYASQAQSAADESQVDANLAAGAHTQALTFESQTNTAVSSIGTVSQVSTAPATSAIGTAGTSILSAQAAVTSAAALTPVDLTAATSAVSGATTNFNAQQTAFNNLGLAADVTPASNAVATANAAITSATSAVSSLSASPASVANAITAITNASGAIGTADTAVTNVNALAAPNTALATTNAGTSTGLRSTAETQAAQAAASIAANGSFADAVYAVPANTATQGALATVQSKDTLVQTAAGDATTQAAAFNTAKSTANTLLGSANTSLGLANAALGTATAENTNFTNAKSAANTALGSATTNLATANTALSAANSFNTTFNTGTTAAQNSLTTASGQLATAGSELTSAQNANAALIAAIAAAQQALSDANTALAAANSQLTAANTSNTAIATAQAAVTGLSSQAAAAVAAAQGAANLAQVAATAAQVAATDALTKQNAGDFAGAQAALNTALARLGDAQTQLTAAQTAQGQAQTAANTANTQLAAAQTAVTAASTAVSAAVTAAGNASSLAGNAVTQSGAASTQQAAAGTAAGNASTAAGNAQSSVTSAQGSIGTASAAKSSAASSVTSATTAAGAAQIDAGTAQTQAGAAATAFTAASTAATSAESQANTAQTQAGTAQTSAGTATSAQSAAVAAVNTTTTELGNAQIAANTVATNYQQAQYNNPAVASSNFSHAVHSQRPLSGTTTERAIMDAFTNNPNTVYVLDGNKSLVEIRNTTYESYGWNYPAQTLVTAANARFSGGTAFDTYYIVDADGAFYMGRWAGGQIDITGPITRTDILGPASAHWLIGLFPSNALAPYPTNVNNVQTLTGTANYTLLANTQPTDSFGGVGVLNSATLSANFSSQTVNAGVDVSFASRDLQITGSATNVPIGKEGFEAYTGGRYQPVVNCSGVGCPNGPGLNSYAGKIGGAFGGTQSGTVGARAVLGYGFVPIIFSAPPNTPFSDYLNGFAVLSTAATPTPGVLSNFNGSANVRNEAMYSTQAFGGSAAGDIFFGSIRDTVSGLTTNPGFIYNGPRTSYNVMFDAAGNLARIFDTSYVIFDLATDVAATTTNFRVPTPLANAQVSFGANGSVPAEHYEYTPTGYTDPIIRLGRWQGGAINVLDTATGDAYLDPILGSAHWLVRQGVPSFAGITGTHYYSRVAATVPTDHYGNIGTLEAARLAVDFNRMLVSLGLRVSMPSFGGYLISARASEAPIVGGGFNVSSTDYLKLSCTGVGCAPGQTYGGRVRGAFAGENAAGTVGVIEGAYYRYTFNTNYPGIGLVGARANDEYINGYAAFGLDPAAVGVGSTLVTPASNPALFSVNGPGQNPPGDAVILNAYAYTNNSNPSFPFTEMRTNSFDAAGSSSRWGAFPPGNAIDGSGNLTFASHFFEGDNERITIAGGASPVNFSAQGITHGYVYQPNLSGVDWNGPFGTGCPSDCPRVPLAAFHWLRGPALYPWYAGEVMTHPGTTNVGYAQLVGQQGGLVTNQAGIPGSVTATLQVNFNAQSVNTSINAVVSGGTFAATANGIALDEGGFFWASSGGAYRHTMGLTFNGSSANTWGNLNGLLTNTTPGAAPNDGILGGAGVAFAFQGPTDTATGTLVFGNPVYTVPPVGSVFQPSALMDYRFLLVASGMTLADPANGVTQAPGSVTRDGTGGTSLVSEWDNYQVRALAVSSDRIQSVSSTTVAPVNPQGALVKFDGYHNMIWNSCTMGPACNSETQLPVRYALADATGGGPTVTNGRTAATAIALESGYDPASGVRWGRWGGGVMNVGDRASANGAVAPPSGTAPATVDLTAQNWHYLMTSSLGGPVTIPTTGTASYTLVGGTSPTAYTPGQTLADVGTLGSVNLAVNFGTQQITTLQVNASTPVSGNWSASNVGNLPILQNSVFFAEKSLSGGGNLQVTRTPVSGSPTTVNTAGTIIGGFTNNAAAAGLAYSLNHGGPTGSTISGVAVMRK
ncbi:MAG: hypothetical protein Q8K18_16985 [Burkholderiales bacterium]|nr:hypothetical protein [Burkholderiales bacterium]